MAEWTFPEVYNTYNPVIIAPQIPEGCSVSPGDFLYASCHGNRRPCSRFADLRHWGYSSYL